MMTKKVLIEMPETIVEELDTIAKAQNRTRSDLIRDALKEYTSESNTHERTPKPVRKRPRKVLAKR